MEEQIATLISPEILMEKEKQILVIRREMGQMRTQYRSLNSMYTTLTKSLERRNDDEIGKGQVQNQSQSVGAGGQELVEDLLNQIESLKAQLDEGKISVTAREDNNVEMEVFVPDGNYFNGLGLGHEVPDFLKYEGALRNWRLSKRECERTVNDIWIGKEVYQVSGRSE